MNMKKDGCEPGEIIIGGVCISSKCKKSLPLADASDFGMHHYTDGIILPNGSFLDSEGVDHNYVVQKAGFSDYHKFMDKCKSIRFTGFPQTVKEQGTKEVLGIQSIYKPTGKQIETLARILTDNNFDNIIADKMNNDNTKVVCGYSDHKGWNNKPMDLQRWVSRCWK